ncbi:MAG: T9SS sorting signal type C domain-containing protein [Flavobacterium sp.]|uniref:T9SS sorting signal type C domain-containing protein n=1 Tax=Flavobacterium sp. TaxID=239 RepID=UPI00326323D1
MKNRILLVTLLLFFCAIGFSQNPVNGGFENGSINAGTDWAAPLVSGTSTVTTTNARTGTYSLAVTTSSNAIAQDNVNASVISVPDTWYGHIIGWVKGSDANTRAQMRGTLNAVAIPSTLTGVGALNNILMRITASSAINGTGSAKNFICRGVTMRSNVNGTATTAYWDDIIMYTSPLAAVDLTKPSTAASFVTGATLASSATFTWTNGSDLETGIQNTIILRTTVASPTTPVMNDQGVYSTAGGASGPNIVSTDWTVVSTSVAAGVATYTDTTVAAGTTYKYAVIHRDLAYNYSAALVSGSVVCPPSAITSTTTGGLWSVGATWVGGVVPASNTDAIIATGAVVTLDGAPNNTRDAGTYTTVNTGATLATGAFAYNNNGTTTVNGTFQLDTGGSVAGNDFVYGGASTLNLNTTVTVINTDKYWPASGPFNVTVLSGGLTMSSANRTVAGTFQTAVGVTLTTSTLTLSGTCQINAGGFFVNVPTYTSASTLIYNTAGPYSVSNEWTGNSAPPAAGLGTPQNVIVQNSTTLTMPAATRSMAGNLSINSGSFILNGANNLYIAGNWTRVSTAVFTPATGKVFFSSSTANTLHTITVSGGGTETFYLLEVQFTGTLKMATGTNVTVTGSGGLTFNSTNATSVFDLNGQTLTLSGGGTLGCGASGIRNITSTLASGILQVMTSSLTFSSGGAGSLVTDANSIVKLKQAAVIPGSGLLTVNGTLQMDASGSVVTNAPIYGNASTLSYISGAPFTRGLELSVASGTIGTTPGFPNNVLITNSTTLNYYNASTGARAINGKLDIDAGSSLIFGATSTVGALTVPGNVTNAGTITLGAALGDDLKTGGNYSNTGAGVFNGNSRAIWFIKGATQTVNSVTALTIPFVVTSASTSVQLLCDVVISSSASGTNVITFGAGSEIDINGKNLTIGATGNPGVISGTGTFKGSTTSNLTILGTASVGTISFTTGSQNLGTFTMNRQAAAIGCVLGSAVTVNTNLALANGLIDLSTNNLTIAAGATTSGASVNSYVLAYTTTGGQLIKAFTAAGSFTYPIGDNTSGLDYSPATLTFVGGTYAGTVGVRVVDAVHGSISGFDNLSRYWQVLVSGVAPASYTFAGTYLAADINNTEANCLPQCYNGSSWTDIGATAIGSNTCTVTGTAFPYASNEFSAQTGSLYYRSKTSGDWSVAGTWESSTDNATWVNAAAAPTVSANTITILTGHTVTITSAVTMDQVYVTGNLTASGSSYGVTINNGTGTDLTINSGGVVTMIITGSTALHGWIVSGAAAIAVLSGGTYVHNTARAVSAFLDQTTFDTNSTIIYRGSSSLTPAVSLTNRVFGHLRFESTSGALLITVPSFTTTCTSNDFYIGSNVTLKTSSGTTGIFAVSGNFTNNGTMDNSAGYFNFNFSGATKTISGTAVPSFDTVNITSTGSYTLSTSITFAYTTGVLTIASGGTLDNGGANQVTGSASASVVVNGKFITRDAQGFTGTNAAIPTLTTTLGTSSTVEYGGASQTVTAFSPYYYNVTVSGTGTKSLLTTPIIMYGDLNVNASLLFLNLDEVVEVKKAVNVATGAFFELSNNAQLIQDDDIVNGANIYNGSNTGNIIYNRTAASIKGYDYVYWATPVAGPTIDAIYSSPSPGFKYFWNPTVSNINTAATGTSGNWQTASGAMTPGKGYIVRGSSSYGMAATSIPVVFTGIPNNGQITTPISRGGNTTASQTGINSATVTNLDDNWNLVANPYPSAIDALSFLTDNNNLTVNGFVWLWRHNSTPTNVTNVFYGSSTSNYDNNDYIAYNSLGSTPAGFNGKIAAGQSFFISMVDGAAATQTVIFKNTMRKDKTTSAINNNSQFYKNSSHADSELGNEKHRIWLDLLDVNNQSVTTLIGYATEATVGLDRMFDAAKNTANEKSIYSLVDNTTLIIQGRPVPFDANDQVAVGINTPTAGDYKIAIGAVDGLFSETTQNIYLEDKLLNVIHDLRQEPYTFNSVAGIFNDRFVLRYTDATLSNPDLGTLESSVVLAANHGEMTIKSSIENISEVTVYDVLGRQLFFAKAIDSNNFVTSNISMSQQTLIVKIKLENGVMISRKIIL